jgi:hypothetical protein
VAALTGEAAFLAAAAVRLESLLSGLAWLAGRSIGLGLPAGAVLLLAGAWLLLDGARRPRALGAVGGAAAGALAVLAAQGWLGEHLPAASSWAGVAAGAVGGAVAGGLLPPAFLFAVGALPGGVLASVVEVGGSRLAGLLLGAAALGSVSVFAGRATRALAAGTIGALASGAAGLALLGAWGGRPLAEELAGRPLLLVGWLLVVGVAGAARHLAAAGSAPARPLTPARTGGP